MTINRTILTGILAGISLSAQASIQPPPPNTTFSLDLNPLTSTVETVTLNKYTGTDPLSKVTVSVSWEFDEEANGLIVNSQGDPSSGAVQTALVNRGPGTAEVDLWSSLSADIIGFGVAIDGSGQTQTDVQNVLANTAYQFDTNPTNGEKTTPGESVQIIITGTDLSFFASGSTFDINLAIDGGWNTSALGDGAIEIDSATALSVRGSVRYESIPEPSSLALLSLGGLALMRRRRRA